MIHLYYVTFGPGLSVSLIAYLSSLQTDLYFKLKLLVMQPQSGYYAFIVFPPSDGDVAHYSIWPDILQICPLGTQL